MIVFEHDKKKIVKASLSTIPLLLIVPLLMLMYVQSPNKGFGLGSRVAVICLIVIVFCSFIIRRSVAILRDPVYLKLEGDNVIHNGMVGSRAYKIAPDTTPLVDGRIVAFSVLDRGKLRRKKFHLPATVSRC